MSEYTPKIGDLVRTNRGTGHPRGAGYEGWVVWVSPTGRSVQVTGFQHPQDINEMWNFSKESLDLVSRVPMQVPSVSEVPVYE